MSTVSDGVQLTIINACVGALAAFAALVTSFMMFLFEVELLTLVGAMDANVGRGIGIAVMNQGVGVPMIAALLISNMLIILSIESLLLNRMEIPRRRLSAVFVAAFSVWVLGLFALNGVRSEFYTSPSTTSRLGIYAVDLTVLVVVLAGLLSVDDRIVPRKKPVSEEGDELLDDDYYDDPDSRLRREARDALEEISGTVYRYKSEAVKGFDYTEEYEADEDQPTYVFDKYTDHRILSNFAVVMGEKSVDDDNNPVCEARNDRRGMRLNVGDEIDVGGTVMHGHMAPRIEGDHFSYENIGVDVYFNEEFYETVESIGDLSFEVEYSTHGAERDVLSPSVVEVEDGVYYARIPSEMIDEDKILDESIYDKNPVFRVSCHVGYIEHTPDGGIDFEESVLMSFIVTSQSKIDMSDWIG